VTVKKEKQMAVGAMRSSGAGSDVGSEWETDEGGASASPLDRDTVPGSPERSKRNRDRQEEAPRASTVTAESTQKSVLRQQRRLEAEGWWLVMSRMETKAERAMKGGRRDSGLVRSRGLHMQKKSRRWTRKWRKVGIGTGDKLRQLGGGQAGGGVK
jgi:hypothetical protein